jgi:hypothetical protein
MSSNTYGYIADTGPTQAYGSNNGVFDPADINDLIAENKWSGVGSLELIETQSVTSSTASIIFSDIKEDEYNIHFVTWNNFRPTVANKRLVMRFYESGVEESGSVYESAHQGCRTDTFSESYTTTDTAFFLGINPDTTATYADNGYVYIYSAGDNAKYTAHSSHSTGMYHTANYSSYFGGGVLPQQSIVDQLKFFSTATSNIEQVDISLYGIKEY